MNMWVNSAGNADKLLNTRIYQESESQNQIYCQVGQQIQGGGSGRSWQSEFIWLLITVGSPRQPALMGVPGLEISLIKCLQTVKMKVENADIDTLVRCDELGFSTWTKLEQNPAGMLAAVVSV